MFARICLSALLACLALSPAAAASMRLNVVVTGGVLVVNSAPDYPRNGQMLILDCGPNTYNASALDWPQYQQNAQRMGFLP